MGDIVEYNILLSVWMVLSILQNESAERSFEEHQPTKNEKNLSSKIEGGKEERHEKIGRQADQNRRGKLEREKLRTK